MIGIASLGSGSRGNATLVCMEDELLLIDCGFTVKQVEARLARLGVRGGDISAILVTHEHSDHASGVAALAHKYALPIYASHGTYSRPQHALFGTAFDGDVPFEIGDVQVDPVRVPHDASEPTQFVMRCGGVQIGVLSDLGCVTPHVIRQFSGCDLLMLEANHDVEMLQNGKYPPALKRRIRSDLGHLSNEQAAYLLDAVADADLNVLIGHVSEENNSVERIEAVFEPYRRRVASIELATQSYGSGWIVQQGSVEELPVAQQGFALQAAQPNC